MKKILFFLMSVIISSLVFAQNAYSPSMIKAFADNLYVHGFWDEAESEYKRYLFISDNKSLDENAILNLGHIYFNQKDKDGINWLKNNFQKSCGFETYEQLNYIDSYFNFYEMNKPDYHLFYYSLLEDTERLEKLCPEWKLLYALSFQILEKQIKLAAETSNKGLEYSDAFASIAVSCEKYKVKSPALALSMSAVIPGSGKWYSGNFWTGFSDLLSIGGFTAASVYYGINNGPKDWRPWTYGSLAALFYVVDLYGSYNGAKRYNQAQYYNLCNQVDVLYEKLY